MEVGQREFSLRGGRIILHTRADDRHGVWQCRLRLGTERKLVRRSMKTTDLTEAKAPFLRGPKLADVPYPVRMEPNQIVEFYSR